MPGEGRRLSLVLCALRLVQHSLESQAGGFRGTAELEQHIPETGMAPHH